MNLLTLVRQASMELGINATVAVATATDPAVLQLFALINRLGSDLAREFVWQELDKEYLLTTATLATTGNVTLGSAVISNIPSTALLTTNWAASFVGAVPFSQIVSVGANTVTLNQAATQTGVGIAINFGQNNYPLPTDWLRQIEGTEWDRTNRWPLNGPKSPQEWQNFKSGIVYAGPRLRFRIQDKKIVLNPTPTGVSTLSMEYVSKNWVTALAGTTKDQFTLDTDNCVFDDSLLIEGLMLRWKKSKGLTFDESAFNNLLAINKGQNKSAPTLSLAQGGGSLLLSTANLPDGNWRGG